MKKGHHRGFFPPTHSPYILFGFETVEAVVRCSVTSTCRVYNRSLRLAAQAKWAAEEPLCQISSAS
jgi:hypothetical protein